MAEGRDEVRHPEVRVLQGREARLLEASGSPPGGGASSPVKAKAMTRARNKGMTSTA